MLFDVYTFTPKVVTDYFNLLFNYEYLIFKHDIIVLVYSSILQTIKIRIQCITLECIQHINKLLTEKTSLIEI